MQKRIATPIGILKLIKEGDKIKECRWDSAASNLPPNEISSLRLERELEEYFRGERRNFDLPMKMEGTEFQLRVWKEIYKIPYGHTISYKELAHRCGSPRGYRAVARACGANPLCLLVPCHRVVGSNGSLGGYTGGLDKKIFLLQLESQL